MMVTEEAQEVGEAGSPATLQTTLRIFLSPVEAIQVF